MYLPADHLIYQLLLFPDSAIRPQLTAVLDKNDLHFSHYLLFKSDMLYRI